MSMSEDPREEPPAAVAGPGTVTPPAGPPSVLERALEWAGALSAAPPWVDCSRPVTVLLTAPPDIAAAADDVQATSAGAWLIVEAEQARALPQPWRDRLTAGAHVEHLRTPDGLPVTLSVMTVQAVERAMDGSSRRSLEARWTVRHAHPVHDPLSRLNGLRQAAGMLPADATERITRSLFLQAVSSLRSLAAARPSEASAGEAGAAVARLACVLDEGSHPPVEWLIDSVRQTAQGQRLSSWFQDLPAAVAGDERAVRWVADAGDGVLRELTAALRAEYSGRPWLQDPDSYLLRPPR